MNKTSVFSSKDTCLFGANTEVTFSPDIERRCPNLDVCGSRFPNI